MIETYQQEIIRKKRAARLFWFIVFLFAWFLYFFFQGYYPSINLSLRSLTSTGELLNEPRDIIRSFWIINVSVDPKDSTILLSGGWYANDEKRMTNYGTYSLLITHEEYIPLYQWIRHREGNSLLYRPSYAYFTNTLYSILNMNIPYSKYLW